MAKVNVANTLIVPVESTAFPYHDDYDESKNFHRILFRPGYAVQGRELTQLQTILQNQIERFGRHIFVNGSSVIGGDILVPENTFATLKIESEYNSSSVDVSQFINKVLILGTGSDAIKFRCVHATAATTDDPASLYGNYITYEQFFDETDIKVEGEEIYATLMEDHKEMSRLAFLRDSIFFYNGFFIKVPAQIAVIGKYNTDVSCRVGLELDDSIITENDDSSLLDPAQEAFNYQAPGAARYKVELVLTTRSLTSTDDTKFIELARVENGKLKSLVKYPLYSEIEEVLARRTYDESGNYTVRPYVLSFSEDRFDPENYYAIKLSPGKAYIYGYEHETISDSEIRIPKARTKKAVSQYDLNMNYGNYVIVENVFGSFDMTTMALVDMHCVTNTSINTSSAGAYARTKIGTCRVRDLEFFSGDSNVDARKYEMYIFDTQFNSINTNILSATGNTITVSTQSGLFSTTNNAYTNCSIRLVDTTTSREYSYEVGAWNGASNTFTLRDGITFDFTPDGSDSFFLDFDFSDVESFVIDANYTANATSNAHAHISTLNKSGSVSYGDAFISESSLNTLIFKIPDDFVANNIANTAYTYRRKFTDITFTAGTSAVMTAATNEQFVGATSSSNVSSTIMDNFMVVVTNKQSSGRVNGEVVKVTASISGDPEQATLDTANASETFIATVYAKMEFDRGVEPKLKTLHTMSTQVMSDETPVYLTGPTGSSANVYLADGQVVISEPSRIVGEAESLYIADVAAVKIYDLDGEAIPASGADIYTYADVTDRYAFDNGQRDTHYDHASIALKPGKRPCKGPLIVCCRWYEHSTVAGGGGFFNVDSYPDLSTQVYEDGVSIGDGYSIIPSYTNAAGTQIELRDTIDFRPTRTNASNLSPNYVYTGIKVPVPTTDFELDYEYYLGRRDLLVLNINRTFSLIQGTPAKLPFEPTIPSRAMVLYTLNVPPYTEYSSNIAVKYIDNKRYTMRDIGKIDKRVENLEYYVSLNALEKSALDISITDVDGLNRTKYGVFVDSFTGHSLGRTDLDDYHCAMNFQEGWLQHQESTYGYMMKPNTALSTGVVFTRDKVMLDYEPTLFLEQPYATKYAPVAELLYAVFEGNIITIPEADIWKSTNVAPDIIISSTDTTEYTTVEVYESIVNSQTRR